MRPLDPRLLKYAKTTRKYMAFATVNGIVTAALVIAQALILGELLASVFIGGKQFVDIRPQMWALGAIVVLRAVTSWASDFLAARSSAQAKSELRIAVLRKAEVLGPAWINSKRSSDLTNISTRGLDSLDTYFSRYLPQLILSIVIPLTVGITVLTQDILSAVIIALTIPLIPIFMALIGWVTQNHVDKQWKNLQTLSGHFLDLISGLPTLKAFNRSKAQAETIRKVGTEYRSSTMGVLRISFLSSFALELIATLSVALVAVSIGLRLVSGSMQLREGLIILLLVPEAYLPLRQVGANFHAVAEGLEAANHMFEILERPVAEIDSRNLTCPAPTLITVSGINFSYPGSEQAVLSEVSTHFKSGEFSVVTGVSGSGKTTLLNLLLKFVTPNSGEVQIDGIDLSLIDTESWRSQVSYLPQIPWLPNGSVRDALLMAGPASDSQLLTACAKAGLNFSDTEAFPFSLDTRISTSSGLSTGQRRRIALARVLLRDSKVVILDEPTASVDGETEGLIVEAIEELKAAGKIVIAVAHHPSVIAIADNVVQISEPKLLEIGLSQ